MVSGCVFLRNVCVKIGKKREIKKWSDVEIDVSVDKVKVRRDRLTRSRV